MQIPNIRTRCQSSIGYSAAAFDTNTPVLIRCGGNLVAERPEAVDLYFDAVAGLDGAYSGGGSGRDQVAGFEGDGGADVAEKMGDSEDEVGGGAVLPDLSVKAGGEAGRGARGCAEPAWVGLV